MEEKKFTLQDIIDAMESGKKEGWKEGYLAAKLGIDWVEHYDDEDWKKIVKGFVGVAHKEREEYEKQYNLPALVALLNVAHENYQDAEKKEKEERFLTLNKTMYNLGIELQFPFEPWSEES